MPEDQEATTAIRTIGRYRIYDELGRGAMGIVYRGFDPIIGRTVALKTLALSGTDSQAREFRDRLYREAAAAGALSYPGIVTVFDIVEEAGTTAVAMEYIEGRSLASLIEERAPLALDYAIDILEQLCSALDYAATHAIVHRDIKPANILLTGAGRVKITDFGVAKLALSTMTQAGTVLGSPSYMSPEQVRGLTLDGRSDLFSATVVFYEMITRERPFSGSDVATTMYRIAHEAPTPPNQFNTAVGPSLTAVLERALAKNPDDRFRTGGELIAELRRVTSFSSASPDFRNAGASRSGPSSPLFSPPRPQPAEQHTREAGAVGLPLPEDQSSETELPPPEAIIAAATAPASSLAPLPGLGSASSANLAPAHAGIQPGPPLRGADRTATSGGRPSPSRRWAIVGGSIAAVVVLAVIVSLLVGRGSGHRNEDDLGPQAGTSPDELPQVQGTTATLPVAATPEPIPVPDGTVVPRPPAATSARRGGATPPPGPVGRTPPASGQPASARPLVPVQAGGNSAGRPAPTPRGRVFEANQVDQRPVLTRQVEPVYPPDAAKRGVEDVVILKLVVLASGRVDEVQVLRGSTKDAAFDAAAIAAVEQWEFAPAWRNGTAVNSYYNVGVPFQLKK